jgi:hypothetical protein
MGKVAAHVETNKNVNWMDSRGFWTFYIMLLGSLYMAMPIIVPAPNVWTAVNVLHGVVSPVSTTQHILGANLY